MRKIVIIGLLSGGYVYYTKTQGDRDGNKEKKFKKDQIHNFFTGKKGVDDEDKKVRKTIYKVGECVKSSRSTDWEFYKILKVDLEKNDYIFSYCVKYKGCSKERQSEIITNFEIDYPASFKTPCP